ncbi:MAG: DinB family protein [Dongiaceae bacterium]
MFKGDLMQTTADLAAMPDEIEALLRQVPAARLDWKPDSWDGIPGERFSALEQACHLRDIEIDGYHARFGRTLQETRPDLASIDSYELARERNYGADDVGSALAAFRTARGETIALLGQVRDDDWERKATFAEYGEVTLRGLAHILRSHDLQHLACLHWLLAKMAMLGSH